MPRAPREFVGQQSLKRGGALSRSLRLLLGVVQRSIFKGSWGVLAGAGYRLPSTALGGLLRLLGLLGSILTTERLLGPSNYLDDRET